MSNEDNKINEPLASDNPGETNEIPAAEVATAKKNSTGDTIFSWLQALVFALTILVLTFAFLGRMISVEGLSMYPTLHDGDMLVLRSLGYEPEAGDVVVLTKPFANITSPIVKRVIATEGQHVVIDYAAGTVSVDGEALNEPYINEAMQMPDSTFMDNNDVVVPENAVFVMGDNRNHSSDSRDNRLGVVDERQIIGEAIFAVFPFSSFGLIS
ncbi:MAG: signal peptidase I [Evtepia sp.]